MKVEVSHAFRSAPEKVFDAWLDPDLIARWMFHPDLRGDEVQGISVAPRVGGSFSFRVLRGGEHLDHAGRYLELERPRRLAFTWGVRQYLPESSTVEVEIAPTESGARLTLTHELSSDAAGHAEQIRTGWETLLDVLDAVLD